jgi:general secretion pathway protein L
MRTSLLIHLHNDPSHPISWVTFNSAGKILNSAKRVTFDAIPRQPQPPIILLPGTDIVLTHVDIPSKQWKRIAQAVPYALEEQLAEDVENLHFALGKREPSSGDIAVAVIARAKMDAVLQQLSTVNITPTILLPDILAVPKPEDGWGLLYLDDIVLVRTGLQAGFAIEPDCLSFALQKALIENEEMPPQEIAVYRGEEQIITLTELQALGIPIIEQTHEQGTLAWLAQGFTENKPLNLIQSDYLPQDKILTLLRPWRLTIGLLIFLGGLQFAKQWVEYQELSQQRQRLNAQIETVYRDTFPEARKIVNPRVQMEQKLKALRTQKNTTENGEHFLSILNKISIPLTRTPGFKLKRILYRQGSFEIEFIVSNLQALEYLKQRLSRLGLSVEIQSATSRYKSVESRLRINK